MLGCFAQHWEKEMAGEVRLAQLLYLIGTSRLLAKPMHAVIKGPSGAGKSEIRKQVLRFFPGGEVISFTAMSDKALIYDQRSYEHKITSMAEANAVSERHYQDYLLRELMSEGKIVYDKAHSGPGLQGSLFGNLTEIITKQGPVSFLVTTTKKPP